MNEKRTHEDTATPGHELPAQMRAVVVNEFGPIDSVAVEQIPLPTIAADEVLIRSSHAGVNFPDAMVIKGTYQVRPGLPFTPGKELTGTVVRVGEQVTNVSVGQSVIARVEYGAWCEYASVRAASCSIIPDNIAMADAMALGLTYQTAWFALHERAHFKPGQRVLITGAAGGVGLAAVELVAALGGVAIAGVRHESQQELVRQHGAAHVVDLSDSDLKNSLKAHVMQVTDNAGVDIVLDNVGGDVFHASLRALAWSGHVVIIGFAGGDIPVIKAGLLLVKNITAAGLQWSDYRDRCPARVDEVQQQLWTLYADGKLRPPIMASYPLTQFADALGRLAEGRLAGQVLLEI